MGAAAASSSSRVASPAEVDEYRPVEWAEAVRIIRSQRTKWLVQTRARRVYLATVELKGFVTSEPRMDDVLALLGEIDPSHADVACATHQEIPWAEAEALIRAGSAIWLEKRDGRRVYLYTHASEWLLSFEPRRDDAAKLVAELDIARQVKFNTVDELPWRELVARLRADSVSALFVGHGQRVYLDNGPRSGKVSVHHPEVDVMAVVRETGSHSQLAIE